MVADELTEPKKYLQILQCTYLGYLGFSSFKS